MTPSELEAALVREGVSLIAHGSTATPSAYVEAMRVDLTMYGRCYERVSVDGSRELIDPMLFARTCSRCGRGFFEDASAPALEAVARKRCPSCR